ncbi:MAG: hypothetical protein V4685_16205 [Bacteroidota bacterium]
MKIDAGAGRNIQCSMKGRNKKLRTDLKKAKNNEKNMELADELYQQ